MRVEETSRWVERSVGVCVWTEARFGTPTVTLDGGSRGPRTQRLHSLTLSIDIPDIPRRQTRETDDKEPGCQVWTPVEKWREVRGETESEETMSPTGPFLPGVAVPRPYLPHVPRVVPMDNTRLNTGGF